MFDDDVYWYMVVVLQRVMCLMMMCLGGCSSESDVFDDGVSWWLGMYDDFRTDRFVWLDGSIFTFTNFAFTPRSSIHQRYMQLSVGMKWNDAKADNLQHYICKKPSGKILLFNKHVLVAKLSSKAYSMHQQISIPMDFPVKLAF